MAEGTNVYNPALQVLSFSEETNYNEVYSATAQDVVFGILGEEIKLPDPEVEFHQHRNIGSGANLHVVKAGARTLNGNLPVTIQNGRIFKYILGSCADTDLTTYYTHDITCSDAAPPSMCLEALYEAGSSDFLRFYSGVVVTGATIAAEEEGFLKANLDIEAAYVDSSTTDTPSTVTQLDTEPFVFCEGVATYFGSVYARVLDFSVNVKRAFKARRYIQSSNACYPKEINFGPRDIELSTTIVAADDIAQYGTKYYNELLDPTGAGSTMKLVFTRDTHDFIEIELTGCSLRSAPHPLNPSAEDSPIALDLIAKNITIDVEDAILSAY